MFKVGNDDVSVQDRRGTDIMFQSLMTETVGTFLRQVRAMFTLITLLLLEEQHSHKKTGI